ncbi:hypothetical protein [Roseateles saccharophilus]|uniref:Uncharacterized protein n=1 Tax=Roseateles saccharophilus TaxID=304 RepID=A0A4R3UIH9_ROSSA|nr:hypothetical protein [Roseateles saccharophilus]MDG0834841.1 hypothetical protein [Roseateles saccharophilus]TCU88375.1 hypothetical protein EV671_10391 [Roseateles saccharophilus]
MTRHALLLKLCAPLAFVLVGCTAPNAVPPGGEAQLLANIKAGTVQMDCGLACMPIYAINQTRLQQLYRSQDWPGLALATAKTSYRRDIAYFYLGVAAEGMQAWAAADRYYRMAGALATGNDATARCSSVQNMCAGFHFPQDIVARLRGVSAQLGRAPVSAQQLGKVGTGLDRPGEADFIPEAPQALLSQYAAQRLFGPASGNARRDQDFQNQLLEQMDPQVAQSTRGNEIARPRAIQALVQRLGNQVAEPRLVLGLWVQLLDYDLATQSFAVRYPLFSRSRQPRLNTGVYGGESPRSGPRGYTGRGSVCVWENYGGEYVRPDEVAPYFLLLTLCQQRPNPQWRAGTPQPGNAELPPTMQLILPGVSNAGLWPRLRVDETRADALLHRINPDRLVWAELVFDVRALGALNAGPFPQREVVDLHRPGMAAAIMPRALLVWETPPESNRAGQLLAVAGDVAGQGPQPDGRLPRSLVADRSYDGLPEPVIVDPSASNAPASAASARSSNRGPISVPAAMKPAPLPTAATPVPRQTPKATTHADDDEAWVEPPPAKR